MKKALQYYLVVNITIYLIAIILFIHNSFVDKWTNIQIIQANVELDIAQWTMLSSIIMSIIGIIFIWLYHNHKNRIITVSIKTIGGLDDGKCITFKLCNGKIYNKYTDGEEDTENVYITINKKTYVPNHY